VKVDTYYILCNLDLDACQKLWAFAVSDFYTDGNEKAGADK
jgi:hypothetical protein